MPLADQLVQAAHAAHEAGAAFGVPGHCHLAVLSVDSREALLKAADRLEGGGVRFKLFYEPDDDLKETALCSEALFGKERNAFRRYGLWKP